MRLCCHLLVKTSQCRHKSRFAVWLKPQIFVCTLLRFVNINFWFFLFIYLFLFVCLFWKGQYHEDVAFLSTGPVWKLPAMRSDHSNQHSSALISKLWPLVSYEADFNDGFNLSDTNTQCSKIQDTVSPLFGILSLLIRCSHVYHICWHYVKVSESPLVQYVSKQQCLKNGTALSFSIADCEMG